MAVFRVEIRPHTLLFKQPAGTSRGIYTERKVWYLHLTHPDYPEREGIGECAFLPDLSCDALPDYEDRLREVCEGIDIATCLTENDDWWQALRPYPSMLTGIETALWHFRAGTTRLFDTPFSRGEAGIPINGLIWMGTFEEMRSRVEEKLKAGFRCIKLKIGAIGWEEELELLRYLRAYGPQELELRGDANGAFHPDEVMERLEQLAKFRLHSIEQPIRAGQWQDMTKLCRYSPLPIALDEELIGVNEIAEKRRLLECIQPAYIILKPSLHGGFAGADEWIRLAEEKGIGWWATSALESNVGLNAIAQWCAIKQPRMPQGLGTGALFVENTPTALTLEGDMMWYKE